MNEYWVGVFFGALASLVFFVIFFFCQLQKVNDMQEEFKELKTEHERLESWVNENEITMKTYGFLNEQIIKLLEEK